MSQQATIHDHTTDVVPLRPGQAAPPSRSRIRRLLLWLARRALDGSSSPATGAPKWRPSLDQLLQAERVRRRPGVKAKELLDYADLRSRYEEHNGKILDFFLCKDVEGAGSILTSNNEIFVRYPNDLAVTQPGLEDALWRATALAREGHQLLSGRCGGVLASMVQSVMVYLLGILDSLQRQQRGADAGASAEFAERMQKSLATACKELDRIAAYLRRSSQAVSEKDYLLGMLIGLLGLVPLVWAVRLVEIGGSPLPPVVVAVGGLGAVISVMTRISRGQLTLDSHATGGLLRVAGAARPVIGAVMAVVIYVVIQSGLVPIDVPAPPQDAYLFVTIGFLAGFSERFAQDMLARTSSLAMPGEEHAAVSPSPTSSEDQPVEGGAQR